MTEGEVQVKLRPPTFSIREFSIVLHSNYLLIDPITNITDIITDSISFSSLSNSIINLQFKNFQPSPASPHLKQRRFLKKTPPGYFPNPFDPKEKTETRARARRRLIARVVPGSNKSEEEDRRPRTRASQAAVARLILMRLVGTAVGVMRNN